MFIRSTANRIFLVEFGTNLDSTLRKRFFIKQDKKHFSDYFEMIRIDLDTEIGMNRKSSDWLVMNSHPILSENLF